MCDALGTIIVDHLSKGELSSKPERIVMEQSFRFSSILIFLFLSLLGGRWAPWAFRASPSRERIKWLKTRTIKTIKFIACKNHVTTYFITISERKLFESSLAMAVILIMRQKKRKKDFLLYILTKLRNYIMNDSIKMVHWFLISLSKDKNLLPLTFRTIY